MVDQGAQNDMVSFNLLLNAFCMSCWSETSVCIGVDPRDHDRVLAVADLEEPDHQFRGGEVRHLRERGGE